ncbi:MAG: hypothetical protein ACTHJQ_07050 [Rhizobiaceae bacterium]
MATKATYDPATRTFTVSKGVWSGTFPAADLPKWLAFYRRQRELFPNHAAFYDDDVKALEKVREIIKADRLDGFPQSSDRSLKSERSG